MLLGHVVGQAFEPTLFLVKSATGNVERLRTSVHSRTVRFGTSSEGISFWPLPCVVFAAIFRGAIPFGIVL